MLDLPPSQSGINPHHIPIFRGSALAEPSGWRWRAMLFLLLLLLVLVVIFVVVIDMIPIIRFDDAVASARWKSTVAARRKFVARQRGDLVMVSPSNMGVSHGFTMKYAGMLSIIHDGAATIKLWDLHSRVLFVDFSQQTCRGACWWEKTNKRPKRKISRAVTGLAVGAIVF